MKSFALPSLSLSGLSLALLLGAIAQGQSPSSVPLKVGIIGDSTVCNYPSDSLRRGWGQILPEFFTSSVSFLNLAEAGRSTKTFPGDKWQQILGFKPDYVLIQFGHNDSHPKGQPEATDASADFKENLRRYILEAKKAGATPILVTPMHRRVFDPSSHRLTRELEPYVLAMKEVAAETGTPLVDLYEASGVLYESLGEEGSAPFTINDTDHADRPGAQDRTHFTPQGAKEMARLVAVGLGKIDGRLQGSLLSPPAP